MAAKRTFGSLVNNPVMEDYSLRYAPSTFRKWSPWMVLISGLGGIAAMAGYAIGGSLIINFGFSNAFWAIVGVSVIIFLTGLPIAFAIAENNIDMDLLTRGTGFGYLGSTLTSLIYASFTFIYFSLEGAIMAQAITAFFHVPIALSYVIATLIIIPLVMYGMTMLSRFQAWSQPIWLALLLLALFGTVIKDPTAISHWIHFGGVSPSGSAFSWILAATAGGVMMSLVAQIGEQADYLRFMPDKTPTNRRSWIWAVVLTGPGWIIIGAAQNLAGTFLSSFVAKHEPLSQSNVPVIMFTQAFHTMFSPGVALGLATALVLLSQMKINVTNAYSGSLSWSNFFSRVLHRHPGRVVWLFFQLGIGLLIMEMGIFSAIDKILGFYSNIAVAWIGAVVADLVINKPLLRVSPPLIEFKRAHLYNFNPVGFGAMLIASVVSIMDYFGAFGHNAAAFSPYISLIVAMVLSPVIAVLTKGRYYIARASELNSQRETVCISCGFPYEQHDMADCPYHEGSICSLCCTLDAECHDVCKSSSALLHIDEQIANSSFQEP